MSIILRRLTYLSFFLAFIIVAPLLIFYSLGYRYNFDKHLIEKNGAFFVKSYPRNSNIFIDGEKTKFKTPAQVTNVKTGTHLVEIKKEGFDTWQKNLNIIAGETTFIEDVTLFLNEQKIVDLGPGSEDYLINKNKDKYSYLRDNTLWLVNTETEQIFDVYQFPQKTELIDWSKNDQQILIKQNNYKIFDISQQKITDLNILNPDKIIWDNQDENIIWFLRNQKLYKYNIVLNSTTLKADDLSDFDLTGEYIILQNNQAGISNLAQIQKDSTDEVRSLENLKLGKLKIILADKDYLIFMLGSHLYLQKQEQELIEIPASLVEIYGKFLLINDGYQTILYDYNDDYKEIIDRSSQVVSDLKWHPNGSYFINEVNGKSTIYELDGRDYRNNTQVLNDPLKKMYLFNKKGDKLFILTAERNFYLQVQ
ncbi:PEGA domain-containing protein [Candidatus Nomurabacteria bacterium]|nr:PEGA domain-containing protein [Candidatus Nomurabacteria bacterium]